MRHVTDGEIHAFLDGGLDLLPGERGSEIRSHLSSCPACRERLQDEEALRASAEAILADPPLGGLQLPTFEELRERAEAGAPPRAAGFGEEELDAHYRGPLRGLPLAWAATIVLALGVGWMGGQLWNSPRGALTAEGPPLAVESQEALGVLFSDLDIVPSPGQAPEASASEMRSVAEDSEGSPAPSTVNEGAPSGRTDPTPEGPTASAPLLASPRGTPEVMRVPRETESALENSLALPGLKVTSIEWEERIPGEKALLIRQLLSPGDTLELRYVGLLLGSGPEIGRRPAVGSQEEVGRGRVYANVLEASLKPGWHQVVMERERGLLVARAPVSEEDLKALLKSLH